MTTLIVTFLAMVPYPYARFRYVRIASQWRTAVYLFDHLMLVY